LLIYLDCRNNTRLHKLPQYDYYSKGYYYYQRRPTLVLLSSQPLLLLLLSVVATDKFTELLEPRGPPEGASNEMSSSDVLSSRSLCSHHNSIIIHVITVSN